jgi:hypothetical protein
VEEMEVKIRLTPLVIFISPSGCPNKALEAGLTYIGKALSTPNILVWGSIADTSLRIRGSNRHFRNEDLFSARVILSREAAP